MTAVAHKMLTWGKEVRAYLSPVGGVADARASTLLILPRAFKSSFLGPGKAEVQNPRTLLAPAPQRSKYS